VNGGVIIAESAAMDHLAERVGISAKEGSE